MRKTLRLAGLMDAVCANLKQTLHDKVKAQVSVLTRLRATDPGVSAPAWTAERLLQMGREAEKRHCQRLEEAERRRIAEVQALPLSDFRLRLSGYSEVEPWQDDYGEWFDLPTCLVVTPDQTGIEVPAGSKQYRGRAPDPADQMDLLTDATDEQLAGLTPEDWAGVLSSDSPRVREVAVRAFGRVPLSDG